MSELKFSIEKEKLKDSFSILNKCIDTKIDNQVTEGVLFEVKENCLTLSATDTKLFSKNTVDIENVEATGDVVIQYKVMKDLLTNFPDGKIDIELDDKLYMKQDEISYTLPFYDAEMYPQEPKILEPTILELSEKKLKNAISRFLTVIDKKHSKIALRGMYIDIQEDNSTNFAATDGYRLQVMNNNFEIIEKNIENAIIDYKTLNFLKSNLNNSEDLITMKIGESQMLIKTKDFYLKSALIQSDLFPKYKAVVPNDSILTNKLKINSKNAKLALKRLKAIAKYNEFSSINVSLPIDSEKIYFQPSSGNDTTSTGNEKIQLESKELNDNIKTNFNIDFLLDYLNKNKNKESKIYFTKNQNQLMFEEDNLRYITMAVRGS